MRSPCVFSLSFLVFTVPFALSGCGSSQMGSSLSGNNSQSGTPPTVSAVAVQVNGVAPNRAQEVQFSEAMDPSTINTQSFQVADSSGKAVTGAVTYDPDFNIASFQPSPALQAGANYTATISTAAASAGGAHLAQPYTFEFTTRATTDTSPLSVDAVSPFPDAPCVSTTAPITVDFNESPDASTVTPGNFMVTGPNGTVSVKISMNVTTTQVVLTPTAALPSGTITVTVNNVADLAGVKMAAPFTWSFSTICGGGGGGSGGGGATMQYIAPLFGNGAVVGQVTVDTAGNVTAQLHGAAANQMFTEQFCAAYFGPTVSPTQTTLNCFDIGTLSTDSSGDGSSTAKFPQSGAWTGDFSLSNGATTPTGYATHWGTGYLSTLVGEKTVNTGSPDSANGTISYSNSPAPNGSLTFTITGGQANTYYGALQRDLIYDSHSYGLTNSQSQGFFTTDSSGNVTFTVLPDSSGGDIFGVLRHSSVGDIEDYTGGFLVPQ